MKRDSRIAEDAALLVVLAARHYQPTHPRWEDWPEEGLLFVGHRITFKGNRWHVQIGRRTWVIHPQYYWQALERLQWLEYGYNF